MNNLFLQIVSDSTKTTVTVEKLSMINMFEKGGWIMYPISFMLIIAIYLIIERYLTIRKAGKIDDNFMANIKDMVIDGNIEGALRVCEKTNTPVARMIEKGISRIGSPLKSIEVAITNVGKLEVYKLEKGMPVLATISGAAPMMGFLGTVTGMITTFYNISSKGNAISAIDLSGGIYEAMVTTVAGLIVGIIAYLAYNLITAMIEKVVYSMEASSVEFFDILQQPSK